MTITYNQPDMYVTFRDHIRHGNVWTAEVELGMQDTLDEPAYPLWIVVDVIVKVFDDFVLFCNLLLSLCVFLC